MFSRSSTALTSLYAPEGEDGRTAAVSILPGIPLPPGLVTFTPESLVTAVDEAFAPVDEEALVAAGATAGRTSRLGLRRRAKSEPESLVEEEAAEPMPVPVAAFAPPAVMPPLSFAQAADTEDPLFDQVPIYSVTQVAAAPIVAAPVGPAVPLPSPPSFLVPDPVVEGPARRSFLGGWLRRSSASAPVLASDLLEAPPAPLTSIAPPPPYVPPVAVPAPAGPAEAVATVDVVPDSPVPVSASAFAAPSAPPLEADDPESVEGELLEHAEPSHVEPSHAELSHAELSHAELSHAEIVHEELVEAHLVDPDPVDGVAVAAFAHLVPTQQLTFPASMESAAAAVAAQVAAEHAASEAPQTPEAPSQVAPMVGLVFADGSRTELAGGPDTEALQQVAGVLAGDEATAPNE